MLAKLRALFGLLVDIVLLRRGPDSLPASLQMLGLAITLNIATGLIVDSLVTGTFNVPVLQLIVATALPLLWFHVAFSITKKRERFLQTMTAYFGVNMLFTPMFMPVVVALMPYVEPANPNNPAPAALSLLFLLLIAWAVIVWVRIVRSAFEWPYFAVILFVFAHAVVTYYVFMALFGASPTKV